MNAEEVHVRNRTRTQPNHLDCGNSGDGRHPRRLRFTLNDRINTTAEDGADDDAVAAAAAEVAKVFSYAPATNYPPTGGNQQREPPPRAPLDADSPRNEPGSFLPIRRSQTFITWKQPKHYVPIQEKEIRTTVQPGKRLQEAPSRSTGLQSILGLVPQSETVQKNVQPSRFIPEVDTLVVPYAPSKATLGPFHRQSASFNQTAYQGEIEEGYLENRYQIEEQVVNGEQGGRDEEGDFGDYYDEQPASYFQSSEFIEGQNFEQVADSERYIEHSQEVMQPTQPSPSQDSPTASFPVSGFSAGFTKQFEEYVRAHQQEAHNAEERWKHATVDEWKAGKYEMIEHVRRIVDLTKNHMKRKLSAYRTLHDDLDNHKEMMQKRRKLLGKLDKDAQQTGKGLISQLVGKS